MNKDIAEIKKQLSRIEDYMYRANPYSFYKPFYGDVDCRIDCSISLRPRAPLTATEAVYLQQLELRLNHDIQRDIKHMEHTINEFLVYYHK